MSGSISDEAMRAATIIVVAQSNIQSGIRPIRLTPRRSTCSGKQLRRSSRPPHEWRPTARTGCHGYRTSRQTVPWVFWNPVVQRRRPHQGRWCFGKTPMHTFLDALPLVLRSSQNDLGEFARSRRELQGLRQAVVNHVSVSEHSHVRCFQMQASESVACMQALVSGSSGQGRRHGRRNDG